MNKSSSDNSIFDITIQLLILLGLIIWCVMIMHPFTNILLWSIILAIVLFPIHSRLTQKLGGKLKLATFILILSFLIVIIIPTGFILDNLISEIKDLKVSYDNGTLAVPPPSENVKEWPVIGEKLFDFWNSAYNNLEQMLVKYKDQLFELGSKIAGGIIDAAGGLVQIIISLIIAGVILTVKGAGEAIRKFLRKACGELGDEIADTIVKTVSSVVKGVIGEALVLALMNGIVFMLAGIPYAGVWTMVVFILAVLQLPVFIMTIPIMIYMFAVQETTTAIIWSVTLLLVSISDNFLTPLMLGKNAPVPMPVIFIGVIGGCVLSGFIGLFTGAIVMSVGYTLLIKWINPNNSITQE